MTDQSSNTAIRNCRFAFKCNKQWADLRETRFSKVRFCVDCQRDVFLCTTDGELREAVRLNRCVALNQFFDDGPDVVGELAPPGEN